MVHNAFPDERKNKLLSERIEANQLYLWQAHEYLSFILFYA